MPLVICFLKDECGWSGGGDMLEASSQLWAGGRLEEPHSCLECSCGTLSPLPSVAQGRWSSTLDSGSLGSTGFWVNGFSLGCLFLQLTSC